MGENIIEIKATSVEGIETQVMKGKVTRRNSQTSINPGNTTNNPANGSVQANPTNNSGNTNNANNTSNTNNSNTGNTVTPN